jgi:molecular chaperone DnaK (HSP70)
VVLLGIDFGTACTRAVRWEARVDLAAQVASIPSIALAQETGFLVGEAAGLHAASRPAEVVHGLKRMLERTPEDPVARAVAARSGSSLQMVKDQLLLFTSASTYVSPDACVAALLHQAATRAADGETEGERPAVIALPEWYEAAQEAALREAARRAGIHVLRFIGEGVAAALWAAKEDSSERTLAVVNVGAGGTSTTILSIDPQGVYLSAVASDRRWGGDDVTAALVDAILAKAPVLPQAEPGLRETLRQAVEAMKPVLARDQAASRSVRVATPMGAGDVLIGLGARELAGALEGLLGAVSETAAEALDQADMTADELDHVVALGGMSAFPAILGRMAEVLGHRPEAGAELEPSVVLGAAYEAAILAEQAVGPLVLDGKSTGRLTLASLPR